MKTRGAIELAVLLLVAGCGSDAAGPHFSHKNYGKSSANAVPDADGGDPVIDPGTVPSGTDPAPAAAPATGMDPAPGSDPATPLPGDQVVDDDQAGDDATKLAPDAIIKKLDLHSYFDAANARGLKADRGYKSLGLAATQVKAGLTSLPGDGMILTQTFGDGVARSLAAQNVTNSAGDANRTAGAPTASALQTLYRVNSAACPGVFLCIEKFVSAPKDGVATTMCFSSTFPYGALPNYKEADFDAYLTDYGPFTVSAYAGAAVDCANPGAPPLHVETLTVTVSKVDPAKYPMTLHTEGALPSQLAIAFERHRATADMTSPYADETVALNHVTTYVMNTDAAEILALIVTKRQTIDFAAQAGGGIAGRIAAALIGLDGIEVDLHFELCKNLLKPEAPAYCTEQR